MMCKQYNSIMVIMTDSPLCGRVTEVATVPDVLCTLSVVMKRKVNIDKEINEEKEKVKIIKSKDNEVTVEQKTSSIVA